MSNQRKYLWAVLRWALIKMKTGGTQTIRPKGKETVGYAQNLTVDDRIKYKEKEKKIEHLYLAKELKKKTEVHESVSDINCNWYPWDVLQSFEKWSGETGNSRKILDYFDYGIAKTGKNSEKTPGDNDRLAVTQTLLK